jgi:hypothetical protein
MIKKISLISILLIFSSGFFMNVFSQSQSEYALIRRKVMEYPEIWKMTKSEAMTQFDGKQLFINPLSTSQSYIMDPSYFLYSGVAFDLDNGWNRMLYSECLDDWIRAYGTYGSGSGQFSWPKRLECEAICNQDYWSAYYYIFVADASNDRIVKLRYDWRFENQTIINDGVISGNGLELPLDIDINNGFDFYPVTNDYLWVLNGNSQIKRFTFDGTLKNTYGSYGSGVDQFCRPTAIVSGRHYALSYPYEPFANTNYFYVADRGNNRIVWLYKSPGSEAIIWIGETNTDRDIVDLETDIFGHIWAVDRTNGQIIKYLMQAGGILFPLCTFGSSGYGENQFWKPVSLSNTGGYLGCGNVYVLESWTDSSGGQYFTIATDVVDYNVYSDSSHFTHCANYVLVDPAGIYFKIYNESGNLTRTVQPVYVYYSGPTSHWWDGKNDAGQNVASGNYLMKVSAVSVYADINEPGNPPADSITKESWVCNVYPNDILGDVNSNLTVESADIVYLINYLFKGGPGFAPFWKGDTNGDCKVSLGDTVYLINYLFKGGPAPQLNFGCSPWKCQS